MSEKVSFPPPQQPPLTPPPGAKEAPPAAPMKPSDERLLNTAFGKMFQRMAPDASSAALVDMIKRSMNEYCNSCVREIKKGAEKMKKVHERFKKLAEGGSMYD